MFVNKAVKRKLYLLGIGLCIFLVLIFRQEEVEEEVQTENIEIVEEETETQIEEDEKVILTIDEQIRVLLKTDDFQNIYHEKVIIQKEEEEVEVTETCVLEGPVTFLSFERTDGNPTYEGRIEVYKEENGYILINELPLETYLNYVVPSEMPASYEMEALKAQAVCARTYAYGHVQSYAYEEYEAHVDDSVLYQVYRNLDCADATNEAVEAPKGEILTFEEELIHAYYFSTSVGHTSNEDIWRYGDSNISVYLQGKSIDEEHINLNLEEEESFREFILEETVTSFEVELPWYRWEVEVSIEQLSEGIEAARKKREDDYPESIGDLEHIEVVERGVGGVLQKVKLCGSDGELLIETEYDIREFLNAKNCDIFRKDGSTVEGTSLLPSGYFYIEEKQEEGNLISYTFFGGGYGHGVGMSQNAANEMAKLGWTYEELLSYFYQDAELNFLGEEGGEL